MINNTNSTVVQERVEASARVLIEMEQKFGFPFYKRENPPVFTSDGGEELLPPDMLGQLQALGFRCIGTVDWKQFEAVEFMDPTGLLKFEYYPLYRTWNINSYTSDGRSILSSSTRTGNLNTDHLLAVSILEAYGPHIEAIERHCSEGVVPLYRNDQASIVATWWIYDRFGAHNYQLTIFAVFAVIAGILCAVIGVFVYVLVLIVAT